MTALAADGQAFAIPHDLQAGKTHGVQRVGRNSIGRIRVANGHANQRGNYRRENYFAHLGVVSKGEQEMGLVEQTVNYKSDNQLTEPRSSKGYVVLVTVSHRILGKDLVNHLIPITDQKQTNLCNQMDR